MKPASPPEAAGPARSDLILRRRVVNWGAGYVGPQSRPTLSFCYAEAMSHRGHRIAYPRGRRGCVFRPLTGPDSTRPACVPHLPFRVQHHYLTYIADLGRPRVVVPGVAICAFMAFFSDRRRVITCIVAPIVAIVITEYLAKPAVGRMFGGSLCYPSGHMTAVAAVICAFVIAVPPRWRTAAAVLGTAAGIVVGITLMLLRWHYLTDVIAGASVSIASTLIVDAMLHYREQKHAWLKSA